MKIVIMNCSPVKNGATAEIVNRIRRGVEDGNCVKTLCIDDYEIGYCRGCRTCHATAACFQKDDVTRLMAEFDWADRVVLVSPSYWADVPGQFKAFIDRCTPWCDTHEPHASLSGGKLGYAAALRTGPGMAECARILDTLEHFYGHLGIRPVGRLGLCAVPDREAVPARAAELRAFCERITQA